MASYTRDENDVEWTRANGHFEDFLALVGDQSGAERVHLIAHSMGSRVMVHAVHEIAKNRASESATPLFSEIVLAAADIDVGVFQALSNSLKSVSERVTIYASSNDKALKISRKVHGYSRLGESGEHLVVIDGIDTIDASTVETSFLEHSYYGDGKSVLADVYEMINWRAPASARSFIRRTLVGEGLVYYVFRSGP